MGESLPHFETADRPSSRPQETLVRLLRRTTEIQNGKLRERQFKDAISGALDELTPEELAEMFVTSSFLASAGQPLSHQHWEQTHDKLEHEPAFRDYMEVALRRELAPLAFLSPLLKDLKMADLSIYERMAHAIVVAIGEKASSMTSQEGFRAFAAKAMREMERFAAFETEMLAARKLASATFDARINGLKEKDDAALAWPEDRPLPSESVLSNSMYRAFDEMDKVLGIDYDRDKGMRVDPNGSERLYEGAGLGVQTSYSSVLHTLSETNPPPGSLFVDLGSGYGRVGFVIGLLRPDIRFIGYEYVGHRVEVAQAVAERVGLTEHVRFVEQDLSDPSFKIPEAELYYMYDPFSQETYKYVFQQLKEIARRKPITIVTKGRASDWLAQAIQGESGWKVDRAHDEGTLGIFRSIV